MKTQEDGTTGFSLLYLMYGFISFCFYIVSVISAHLESIKACLEMDFSVKRNLSPETLPLLGK